MYRESPTMGRLTLTADFAIPMSSHRLTVRYLVLIYEMTV